jgi:hypothetical protein
MQTDVELSQQRCERFQRTYAVTAAFAVGIETNLRMMTKVPEQ